MKIAGTYTFPASRDEVWAAINDPEVLARSIPGCQKLDQVGENEFESTLKIGLQAVKGVYSGRVKLDDMQPPEHYRINIDGKGSNGFLKGTGTIDLIEEADGQHTQLKYAGDAQIGGTIASVGQRLIEGASKTLINQSLKALAQQIEARKNGSSAEDSGDSGATSGQADTTTDAAGASDEQTDVKAKNEDPAISEAAMLGQDADGNVKQAPAETDTSTSEGSVSETAPAVSKDLPKMTVASSQPSQSSPPATTTMLSSNPMPPSQNPSTTSSFTPRSIVVPEGEQLSETAVMQGMITDFVSERPWLPWVVVAFVLGFLLGRR